VKVKLVDDQLVIASPFLEDPDSATATGERARINPDGTFEHLGREDGIVKVGGKRISLQEIDRLVCSLDNVTDAMALSRKVDTLRGQEILLAIAGGGLTKDAIKRHLRGHIEPVFLPRKIRIVGSLPRDERGKLSRALVMNLFDDPQGGGRVSIHLTVDKESPRFSGHFPGDPLLPALAQLNDIILPQIRKRYSRGALQQLRRVKWTKPLRPGAKITLHLTPKNSGVFFEIVEGDDTCCSGTALLGDEAAS
jgi:3-hydroxymyristoyl/3-hydroxydecanoyl-(acyl carrier protein) dehydratase